MLRITVGVGDSSIWNMYTVLAHGHLDKSMLLFIKLDLRVQCDLLKIMKTL